MPFVQNLPVIQFVRSISDTDTKGSLQRKRITVENEDR